MRVHLTESAGLFCLETMIRLRCRTVLLSYFICLGLTETHTDGYKFCACTGRNLGQIGRTSCSGSNVNETASFMGDCDQKDTVVRILSASLSTVKRCERSHVDQATIDNISFPETGFSRQCNGRTAKECQEFYNTVLGGKSSPEQSWNFVSITYQCEEVPVSDAMDICSDTHINSVEDKLVSHLNQNFSSPASDNFPTSCQCIFSDGEGTRIEVTLFAVWSIYGSKNCLSMQGMSHDVQQQNCSGSLCWPDCDINTANDCLPDVSTCRMGQAHSIVVTNRTMSWTRQTFLIRAYARSPFSIKCGPTASFVTPTTHPTTTIGTTTTTTTPTAATTSVSARVTSTITSPATSGTSMKASRLPSSTLFLPSSYSPAQSSESSEHVGTAVASPKEQKLETGELVGIILAALFLSVLVVIALSILCYMKRRKTSHDRVDAPLTDAELGPKQPTQESGNYVQLKTSDNRNHQAAKSVEHEGTAESQSVEPNEETLTQPPSTYTDGQNPTKKQDSSKLADGHYEEIEDIAPADQISEVPPGDDYAHVIPKRFRTKQSTREGNAAFDDPNDTILVENDVYHRQPEEETTEEPIPEDTTEEGPQLEDQADDYGPDNDTLLVDNDIYHTRGLDDENPSREDDDDVDNHSSPGDNEVYHQALDEGDRQVSLEDATAGDSDNDTTLVENDVYHTAVNNE